MTSVTANKQKCFVLCTAILGYGVYKAAVVFLYSYSALLLESFCRPLLSKSVVSQDLGGRRPSTQTQYLSRSFQDDYRLVSSLSGSDGKPCGLSSTVEIPSLPSLLAQDSSPHRAQKLPATTTLSWTAPSPQRKQSACASCCLGSR